MSSGPFSYALGAAAAFVIRRLLEDPDRDTAEQIAVGPNAEAGMDADAVRDGLDELRERGLAVEGPGGRWSLTDAGRERAAAEAA
jgi:hypothetical protein